jgi:hypothetical protein
MGKTPTFKRTAKAAQSDRLTKWDLIAAIAEDADDAGVPITGAESVLAAKAALDGAGSEYADKTVKALCIVAKFDHESSAEHRRIWRRYGWSSVATVAQAGWSPEAAADLLDGEKKGRPDILAAVAGRRGPASRPEPDFDAECARWIHQLNKVLIDGARLATKAEGQPILTAHAQMAVAIYQNIAERELDREVRQLLESEAPR